MMLIFIVLLIMLKLIKEEYEKGQEDIENFDEISNLCESSEEELEIDDFKNAKEKLKTLIKHFFLKQIMKIKKIIDLLLFYY